MVAMNGTAARPRLIHAPRTDFETPNGRVIRAHDVLSSALVELHAYIGAGQSGAAHNKLAEIMALTAPKPPRPSDSPKYRETFAISASMEKWRNSQ